MCSSTILSVRKDFGGSQLKGTIKWFNNTKGYGFIGCENGPDVFVHYSGIEGDGYRTLQDGDHVRFDIVQGDKGPQVGAEFNCLTKPAFRRRLSAT